MAESAESTERGRSKTPRERLFRGGLKRGPANNFGTIVRALWPEKPALNLAQRLDCSERGAQLIINGERKPPARAIAVIVNEMLD